MLTLPAALTAPAFASPSTAMAPMPPAAAEPPACDASAASLQRHVGLRTRRPGGWHRCSRWPCCRPPGRQSIRLVDRARVDQRDLSHHERLGIAMVLVRSASPTPAPRSSRWRRRSPGRCRPAASWCCWRSSPQPASASPPNAPAPSRPRPSAPPPPSTGQRQLTRDVDLRAAELGVRAGVGDGGVVPTPRPRPTLLWTMTPTPTPTIREGGMPATSPSGARLRR